MRHIKGEKKGLTPLDRIVIVKSQYNQPIVTELLNGALHRLKALGLSDENLMVIEVPGAIEIPLVMQRLASREKFAAMIALGAVVRGETSHYDYVCEQVSQGCQKVMLDFDVPVIFGVLTTENEAQAWDRLGGAHGHKGQEAAECAFAMINIMHELEEVFA